MSNTTIRVRIDPSCAAHPLLPANLRTALPAWLGVSTSAPKLFGYSAMRTQDAGNPKVATYEQVRKKGASFFDTVEHVVTFTASGVNVSGDAETKTEVSELVGIGLGIAAACKVFRINPNRISRFISTQTGKRMDYEIVAQNKRYLHEVRGTTRLDSHASMVKAIGPKKTAAASSGYAAHSGAVVLYSQGGGNDYVDIVDPPAEGGDAPELEEVAVMLEYYHNIYRLTHSAAEWLTELERWLALFRSGQEPGIPPVPSSRTLIPRTSAQHPTFETIGGTIFDLRVLERSVRRFRSFAQASLAIPQPLWLLGTTPELDETVRSGSWGRLLRFEAPEREPPDYAGGSLLPSGVAIVPISSYPEAERAARDEFAMRRRQYLRRRRR